MVGAFVVFELGDGFDRAKVVGIAEGARAVFEGMPELRFKFFTLDEERRRATNVYVWESMEAARGFFSAETVERVTGLYGVRPTIEYAEIAAVVDNTQS